MPTAESQGGKPEEIRNQRLSQKNHLKYSGSERETIYKSDIRIHSHINKAITVIATTIKKTGTKSDTLHGLQDTSRALPSIRQNFQPKHSSDQNQTAGVLKLLRNQLAQSRNAVNCLPEQLSPIMGYGKKTLRAQNSTTGWVDRLEKKKNSGVNGKPWLIALYFAWLPRITQSKKKKPHSETALDPITSEGAKNEISHNSVHPQAIHNIELPLIMFSSTETQCRPRLIANAISFRVGKDNFLYFLSRPYAQQKITLMSHVQVAELNKTPH